MKHELLAPAGSLEIFKAVINAGADAVYLAGDKFGARAYAKNFTQENLFEALDYAHIHGRKIFLTVNTLLKNKEISGELYEYLEPLYQHGLDAIIVQDYGVFQYVRKNFSELPIHVSTQMSVSNAAGAEFLQKQGASRIVTAREISLPEIKKIYDRTGIEIESFIHGALCYCYSGQCLMSSMLGGRSGNRGRCAQPCRLAYEVQDVYGNVRHKKEKYPLSPKDLCTIEQLPKLCEAGIYSFKIEGRMKQLSYAAGVTEIYRKYLDLYESDPAHYRVEQADLDMLMQLGNRNGFTNGYYEMRNGRSMMTLVDSSHSSQAKDLYVAKEEEKIPVSGTVRLKAGEPAEIALESQGYLVKYQTDLVQLAQNRPLEQSEVEKRMKKTGDTPFQWQDLKVQMESDVFLPVKALNELRRVGLDTLKKQMLASCMRKMNGQPESLAERYLSPGEQKEAAKLHVVISEAEMLDVVLQYPFVDTVSLDFTGAEDWGQIKKCADRIKKAGKHAGYCLPYVLRANSEAALRRQKEAFQSCGFAQVLVRSFDGAAFAEEVLNVRKDQMLLDYNMYVYSREAAGAFSENGFCHTTASLELNQKELRHQDNSQSEFWLYGDIPLMISAQCVYKNYDKCYQDQKQNPTELYLKDRYLKKFFIKRNCKDCYNIIYNSQPLFLLHQSAQIAPLGFASFRMSFVQEGPAQIRKLLEGYERAFLRGQKIEPPAGKDSYTNGHLKRGVE